MDEHTCMVEVARFFMSFTQRESCGKCVPCREGTKRMLEILDRIIANKGTLEDLDLLEELGLADFAYKYLSKGQMVNVDGRLQSSSYTARDGTSRTALEVVANNINFCGSKADSTGQPSPAPAVQPAAAPAYSQPGDDFAMIEDDGALPF